MKEYMKKPTKKEIEVVTKKVLKYISNTPVLLSLLYDLNLMPEQLKKNGRGWRIMMRITRAWMSEFGPGNN